MPEHHSQAALAAIINISADAVIVLDAQFRIVRYNMGAERIFQWTEAEMIGQALDRLLPVGARGLHHGHMQAFSAGAQDARRMGERRTIAGVRKNGEEFPADASIARVTIDGDRTFMVTLRDVSDRKRVEDGQRLLAMAGGVLAASLDVESTLASIAELPLPLLGDWSMVDLFTEDGQLRRAAAALAEATSGTEVSPLIANELEPLPVVLPALSAARVAHEGEPVVITDIEAWFTDNFDADATRARARQLGAHSVLVIPLRAGGRAIGALSLVRRSAPSVHSADDKAIGEQFGGSAALALENARLYQEARQAVRERDEMLAIVSHDLRNPVNAIVMLSGALMAQSDAGAPVPVELEQLQSVRAAARQADGLIQDLQDVSRISASRLRVDARPLDVREVVEETVTLFEPSAEDASLTLSLEASTTPLVLADRARIHQVLSNLLANALKFTPSGGDVRVRVQREPGDVVRISVADDGPGISEVDVPRLFERYWQAPRLLRAGSGLGLYIARGIVEAHGGHIGVDTTPGVGSSFWFTLPVAPDRDAEHT